MRIAQRHTDKAIMGPPSCAPECPSKRWDSEPVALRISDEHDKQNDDEAELRQSNACEHRCLLWTLCQSQSLPPLVVEGILKDALPSALLWLLDVQFAVPNRCGFSVRCE
jgi:hypothetical protein